jgi:hypothetical protein
MKFGLIAFLFFALIIQCFAQSDSSQTQTEQTIEDLLEEPGEETDNSDLYNLIEYYMDNPVNLNTASLEELSRLPYLDISTAKIIIVHRKKYGNFFSTNELYSISLIPPEVIKKILPFISVTEKYKENPQPEPNFINEMSLQMRNRILNDLQQKKGFRDNKFEGNSFHIYNRIKIKYKNTVRLGLLTDKDPGEKSIYDFSSGYLSISNWQNFNNIILGDYLIEFGQGLTLWSPFGFSKGSDAIYSAKKKPSHIKPYTSSTENNFFRGAAADYRWEQATLTGFYSKNLFDANVDSVSGLIVSTPLDGYHRTANELLKRKSATETSYGVSLEYDVIEPLRLGFLYYNSRMDHPFYPSNIFDIKGSNFNYYSTYYDFYISNINIFGEVAYDGTSVASYNGLNFSPSPVITYIFTIRNYPRNYINLHGFGFGERSGAAQNEFGIYNGLRWRSPVGIFNFYFDQFKFPYATFENPLPSDGNEFMSHFSTKPLKKLETIIRYKFENKEVSEIVNSKTEIVRRIKQSLRFDITYNPSNLIRFKTRLEYSKFLIKDAGLSEEGYLVFEDIRAQLLKELLIYGRVIFFQTNSFNSAIYEYENDLTGILGNIGLYGEGIRYYLILRYKIIKKISLSFKYSETYKPKEKTLGSGYSEIDGNLDNKFGLQFDVNF